MDRGKLQLIAHEHSFKVRPHRHTSYPGLLFLLLVVGVLLLGSSLGARGAVQNPQSGSVGLTGTVNGPPPSTAAVIGSPQNGSHTTTVPITVSGTCPTGTFVDIEKNSVFAGAADCAGDGTFSISIDLFVGINHLVARVSDALGQFGPDSAPITVTYDAPTVGSGAVAVGRQMFLVADETVVAGEPNVELLRTIKIVGGTAPYALSWDWGDNTNALESVTVEGSVSHSHAYARPGTYHVIVQATDSAGNAAFIQLLTVVNGAVATGTNGSNKSDLPGSLLTAWPLLAEAIFLVLMFWLGERRAMHRLAVRQRLSQTF